MREIIKKLAVVFLIAAVFFPSATSPFSSTVRADSRGNKIRIYSLSYCLETEAVNIEAQIPVIKGIGDKTAQEIFNRDIRDKIFDFTGEIKSDAEEYLSKIEMEERPFFKYQAVVAFDVKNKGGILSLVFQFYQYTGGAHGLTAVESYNLDVKTGENLTLEGFLARTGIDQDAVKKTIKGQIEKEEENYFPGALDYIDNLEDFNYYYEDNMLVIYFQQYDIAPYAAGNPEFRITVHTTPEE